MVNRYHCGKEEESTDDLLIHRDMAGAVCHLLFSLFGLN